ncbi:MULTISPECIES: FtsK/SpoIIIE domain-containing protein [Nocardiopsis]|uniref:Conjugal transfer protein TraB n=1 Tax=Nocardiopsis sinuspersici TaxID=501010 RepID=A0A1V3C6R0_9ACTN|nr:MULTISPECIES: hypothetical protein [Nocardiopsis]OOC56474.1 hypothetical protein NOSIN_23790 [Nocardiopsis sinuspersici]
MARNELVVRGRDRDPETSVRRGPAFLDYARPWIAAPALIPAGFLTHWMWGDLGLGTGLAAAAIAAAGGVVAYAAHRLTAARTWYAHHISTAMTGGAGAWLALATAFGPGRPLMDALLIGGSAAAAIANVHLWARHQGTGDARGKGTGRILPTFDEVAAKLHLKNVRAKLTSDTEMQQRHQITLDNGTTAEELQSRGKELASAYGVAPGAIRVIEDQGRADRAELVITKKDVMGKLIPWPGLNPAHVGTSIADHPLELGVYEDGETFTNQITNRHSLTVGMAGAGKSVYGKVKMVQVAARSDTFTLAIDLAKGRQTLGPVEGAIGWPAYTKKAARGQLDAVKRAIKARANHLADAGHAQWVPGCGLTFLYLLVEEAAEVVDFDEIVEIARVARSVGIHLELSLQRATWGNLDTDTRANLGDGLCFGVRDFADASFVLPDYVTDAGCDPSRWRKSRPGAVYAAIEHVDVDRHAVAAKTYGPPSTDPAEENRDLKAAADALPDQDAKLDAVTRTAFGAEYAGFLGNRTGTATAAAPVPTMNETVDDEELIVDEDIEPVVLQTPDDDPEIKGDLDTEIPPLEEGEDFALPNRKKGTKASAEEARAAVEGLMEEWGPGKEFGAFDLKTELAEMGVERKRSWIYGQLRRLEEEGRLRHEDSGAWTVLESREMAGV